MAKKEEIKAVKQPSMSEMLAAQRKIDKSIESKKAADVAKSLIGAMNSGQKSK